MSERRHDPGGPPNDPAEEAAPTSRPGTGVSPGSPTTAQLRDDIDSGRTQDKVAHSDPAAAPLGTDDEAAGAPPTAEQVSVARRHEAGREPRPSPMERTQRTPSTGPAGRLVWLIVGFVVVCTVAGIALSL